MPHAARNKESAFDRKLDVLKQDYEALVRRPNEPLPSVHGIFRHHKFPVLTPDHVSLFWRYDLDLDANQRHLVDREHGERFWRVSQPGAVYREDDKVGPWKGSYHGVRACLEGVVRADRIAAETDDRNAVHSHEHPPQSDRL